MRDDFDRMYEEAKAKIDKEYADATRTNAEFYVQVEEEQRTQQLQDKLQAAINDAVWQQSRHQ